MDRSLNTISLLLGDQIAKALKIITGDEEMSFSSLKKPKDKQKLIPLSNEDCLVSPDHDSFVLCLIHTEKRVLY